MGRQRKTGMTKRKKKKKKTGIKVSAGVKAGGATTIGSQRACG